MSSWQGWPVLSVGFRPWFLLMLAFASFAMAAWAGVWLTAGWGGALQGVLDWRWHAHEMVFGVGTALVAGFLTTAAQNWTGRRAWSPAVLLLALGLWLAARVTFVIVGAESIAPYLLSVATELLLLVVVARLILLARQWHNLLFVLALLLMVLLDVAFAAQRDSASLAGWVGWAGLLPIVSMLLFIAQRVVPPFSANRLGIAPRRTGRTVAVILGGGPLVLLVLFALPVPDGLRALISAGIALAAGYALLRWWHPAVLREPMLWLLFVGVLTVSLGLAWLALELVGLPVNGRDGPVHALGLGALAVMALGMMTRVSAGHTGRPIALPRAFRPVLVILLGAVVLRLILPVWPGLQPSWLALTAGGLSLVYLAMLMVIGPWLIAERADAHPAVRR
ncbi:NnrS family protein [Guyparkeria hydrothermalis]|uniref:NnrS family protein n=1 Tax=Guyparkeria hydrothermalis TaxID=923 RepID=UPI002021814C|nr:NnrS family protein [Guyparkeria hydrothermalis]MCL7743467.1 NnrS family protein [Guyparkeria hydrothermalis]